MPVFEIPVFSAAAARTAVANGATRLEINRAGSYTDGGTTPTLAEVEQVTRVLADVNVDAAVPLRIMIRPRGPPPSPPPNNASSVSSTAPDFVYTDAEFQQMLTDVRAFAASGLLSPARGDGFVFGVLEQREERRLLLQIDRRRNRQLVEAASPYACVLHRAFDLVVDPAAPGAALAAAQELGFVGVLTAGGAGARGAVAHTETLQRLAALAASTKGDGRVEPIVGGGVRSTNLRALADAIVEPAAAAAGVAFHSSCLADAAAATRDGAAGEVVDGAEVGRIRAIVSSL